MNAAMLSPAGPGIRVDGHFNAVIQVSGRVGNCWSEWRVLRSGSSNPDGSSTNWVLTLGSATALAQRGIGKTGPNADCGVPMQPLTATKSSIIQKISDMAAGGGTNIHQGVMWGYHMLSPTEPLTGSLA